MYILVKEMTARIECGVAEITLMQGDYNSLTLSC